MALDPTQTAAGVPVDGERDVRTSFPAPFGPYLLLHRIGRGGMGEVFLAKTGGMMGIEKHCVVKTLRERFTADPEYVQRFVDEARLVVQLSHRNICPVFDVGRVGDGYYLAMELVLGRDVRSLLDRLAERSEPLPLDCALHVATEMLEALDYAHRHVHPSTGQPLHLVHRDVSPHNVLISFEGEVKLIDFGLAETGRAATDEHSMTGAQEVLGKMAYMAPEQARAEVVDPRADQFAAAVVVYEMVAGERYYEGMTSREVWSAAGGGAHVPRRFAAIDPALQAILHRALAPEKLHRFETCGDFKDSLLAYARGRQLFDGARSMRATMNALFKDDLLQTRELLRRFAHVSSRARPGFSGVAGPGASNVAFSIVTSVHAATIHDPTEAVTRVDLGTAHLDRAAPATKRSRALPAAFGALVLVAALVGIGVASTRAPPPPPTVVSAPPSTAALAPAVPTVAPAAPEPPAPIFATPPPTPTVRDDDAAKKRRRAPAPTTPTAPLTIGARITALRKCGDPCAPPLVAYDKRLDQHPDIQAFKADLERCWRLCAK